MEEKTENKKSESALREEAVLKFWRENEIFKKSVSKNEGGEEFVFYEGPPTANAKPALHHLEARSFKDVIPRYKTMRGFHVRRRAGWDTHGLPVELQIEKKLGLQSKKEIEQYGVAKFNKECKESVFQYIGEWEKFTDRIGYWVDKESAYYTFDPKYIESLWSILAQVHERGLLYKDYKVVPWCPRCGTGLSSHELAQGYQDVKDLSVYVKFKIKNPDTIGLPNESYFVAWTTTPWTLPGNVGLAVGEDIEYCAWSEKSDSGKTETYIISKLAFDRLSIQAVTLNLFLTGKDLIKLSYEPLYPYLQNLDKGDEKLKNAYKVYSADFVNTEEGTGIVHTAVMYGQDDFELGTKVDLPKFHLVDEAGKFIKGTDFLEDRFVKEVDEVGKPTLAVDIIDDLKKRGLFFKQETIKHQYPHCWRCKTALIYYARDSWYIAMSKLREELVKENEKINWEPEHIREGRFGEWLREAKDWAISRERYWGTPLPIWVADDGEKIIVDSYETLKKYTKKTGNTFIFVRHGEAEHNVPVSFIASDVHKEFHLTEKGKKEVSKVGEQLKGKNITAIYSSPFLRTIETAQIIMKAVGLPEDKIKIDPRLGEYNTGIYDGGKWADFGAIRDTTPSPFEFIPEKGESLLDTKKRLGDFLYEIDSKYIGESILVTTHGILFEMLESVFEGFNLRQSFSSYKSVAFPTAAVKEFHLTPIPHNENYELDPHRPFIDEVVLEKDGKEFRRVKEVMDVWFDSGAMPFAQNHYPFEGDEEFEPHKGLFKKQKGYPADFISEAVDQTRGWFYLLLAVGVLMKCGTPFKNAICLGHLLDKEGKKMSKSIGNIVDPWVEMDKFGVDTLRLWMYSVNQPGESKNFDEKTVIDLHRQVFGLLYNVLAFYELYRDTTIESGKFKACLPVGKVESSNILDQWILAQLQKLIDSTTENLDSYKLLEPVRAIKDFIGDLSTWYLRRSRDRIKDGDTEAKATLYFVVKTLAQIMAPFAPFTAEDIWRRLRSAEDVESVHLATWPETSAKSDGSEKLLEEMQVVRDLCTVGNALRKKSNIPLRQPLAFFFVTEDLTDEYKEIIKDELNVKAVEKGTVIIFDERITPELKAEGDYREFVRAVQELRKQKGLTPSDRITITVSPNAESLITKFTDDFKKTVLADEVIFKENDGEKVKAGEEEFSVNIEK